MQNSRARHVKVMYGREATLKKILDTFDIPSLSEVKDFGPWGMIFGTRSKNCEPDFEEYAALAKTALETNHEGK